MSEPVIPHEYAPVFSALRESLSWREGEGQWYALCPAHEDTVPSLRIKLMEDGKLSPICGAACSLSDIRDALNLDSHAFLAGCKNGHGKPPKREVVATYDYVDEHGEFKYQKVRYEPKDFRTRRPNPDKDGDWIWTLPATMPHYLYRLPAILAADPKRIVFVMEGEKACDAVAERVGLITTTNVGGAGKWRPEYTEALRGRHVAVVYDQDPVNPKTGLRPGWEHGKLVANTLHDQVLSVKLITLPFPAELRDKKKGMDDWLAIQKGLSEDPLEWRKGIISKLNKIVTDTPVWVPRPMGPEPPTEFFQGLQDALKSLRRRKPPVRSADEAIGLLRRSYLRLERNLDAASASANYRLADNDLKLLAAVCSMIHEDLGKIEAPSLTKAIDAGKDVSTGAPQKGTGS